MLISDKKRYLLIIRLNEVEDALILTITNGITKHWVKEMNYKDILLLRSNMGLEGPFETFFALLFSSIESKNF